MNRIDLDLRIIIDNSLVEWKELGEGGTTGNEWEDRSGQTSKVFRFLFFNAFLSN